ncbi:DUF3515 domain-containing protein [Mycolicibacter hiberniae]|uniref:Uncharacterized protein n=1 Tax=Mycolicibacter hiberniae TaxID=29314 RepID=A0A7I7X4A8_9MYCO|nr:hypothetical protein AWC09_01810 [Mycolicibacter hiberniae]BBZ23697.1 hypothetical protein MHIB_21150 [Mycolicibacter hiberniae]
MIGPDNDADDGPPRFALILALVVAVAAVGIALTVAAVRHPGGRGAEPVPLATVPAPQADSADCHAVLDALPTALGDYRRAELAEPAPPGAAAWTAADGAAVVLRCGLDRPTDFVVGSPIQVVDHVQWFEVREGDRATWYVVDRSTYLALTLPPGSGPTPIQEISDLIAEKWAPVAIRPGPPR